MGYANSGITTENFVGEVMMDLENDGFEIESEARGSVKTASRAELDKMFESINNHTFVW